MTAKVENHCLHKKTKLLTVEVEERACINCIWYEQYYRRNRGNVASWVPTCTGYCILKDKYRGPLHQPCREFERDREQSQS